MRSGKIKRIIRYSVLQHDSADCGAACLVSAIKYFGGNSSIETIRKLSGTSQSGTSLLGIYQAANACGLDACGYEATIGDIVDFKDLLILHVSPDDSTGHFVVSYGYERGNFTLWDPAKGLTYMSGPDLDNIWKSKKCLSLIPNSSFKFKENDRHEKLEWLRNTIRPEKDFLLISTVIGIVISVLGLVLAVFTQELIDKILPSGDVTILLTVSVLVLILLSSRIILTSIRQYLLLTQGKRFNIRAVDDFYDSLLSLPKSFFDSRKTGDFVARMNDTMRIQRVISDIIGVYTIDFLVLIFTIIAIFHYSVVAAILSIVCMPLMYLLVSRRKSKIINAQHNLMAGYASSESNFIDSLQGIVEIKSLNWQNSFLEKSNRIYSEFQARMFSLGEIKLRLNLEAGLVGTLFLILMLVYASLEVIRAAMTEGQLMAVISLGSALLPSITSLALANVPLHEALVAMNRMFEFTRAEREDDAGDDPNPDLVIEKLELRNISFRFPGRRLILENINLSIEKGKLVSLTGECGSGKSTLANIILRFYDAESGEIIINGKEDANKIRLKNWRSKIGIIPQEIHIFNGTILQNLISELSEIRVNEMLSTISAYGLEGFINSFPSGLLTIVGEEGINLSGGEKQLLAFLRVLVRKPDILIIDEGTAFMDRRTESKIIDLLKSIKTELGILLISHRLNMVKEISDGIFVLENSEIRSERTHKEFFIRH